MSAAGLRVDLYRVEIDTNTFNRVLVEGWKWNPPAYEYRWRLWSSSSIVAASTQGYEKRSRAIANLETVTGGVFEKTSTPESPTPYGMLRRHTLKAESNDDWSSIAVRLVES